MKLTTFDKLNFLMALISLIAFPAGDLMITNGYPMVGIFTLLAAGLGIVNAIVMLSVSLMFDNKATA